MLSKELHRSRTWASDWLRRYQEEGVDGLKDKFKRGRSPEISNEVSFRIRRNLEESKQGWTTKQVNDIIFREWEKLSLHSYIQNSSQVGLQTQGTQER